MHPRAAAPKWIYDNIPNLNEPEHNRTKPAYVTIPSTGNRPSHPDDPPMETEETPPLRRWEIEAIALNNLESLAFMHSIAKLENLTPYIRLAPDAQFWAHTAGFTLSLAARQRFVPSLDNREKYSSARWQPVLMSYDAIEFSELADAMPPSARAVRPTDYQNVRTPTNTNVGVLHRFIVSFIDRIVKENQDTTYPKIPTNINGQPVIGNESSQWAYHLTTQGSSSYKPESDSMIRLWLSPLDPTDESSYQTAFQILPPNEDYPEHYRLLMVFQSLFNDNEIITAFEMWQRNVPDLLEPTDTARARREILKRIGIAAEYSPTIQEALKRNHITTSSLSQQQAIQFAINEAPELEKAGFKIFMTEELKDLKEKELERIK